MCRGYGCEDHFLENDTITHSWEVLGELMKSVETENMICDFGMYEHTVHNIFMYNVIECTYVLLYCYRPVLYKAVRYNCRVIVYNKRIILIRPKLHLAMDGVYGEARWFTAWTRHRYLYRNGH